MTLKIGKLLIEIQGDFQHANPKKYKATDVLNFGHGIKMLAQDIWNRDETKKQLAYKNGYDIAYLFESNMKYMTDTDILNFIKQKIGDDSK